MNEDIEALYERNTWRGPLPSKPKQPHPLAGQTPGVRSTSRQAFHEDVVPKIGARQQEVLDMIQKAKRPINNQEISKYLGWPINSVTPRVNELVEAGKVIEAFRDIYPVTGRKTIYWKSA